MDYACRRRRTIASPARPVPKSARQLGSGTTAVAVKVELPLSLLKISKPSVVPRDRPELIIEAPVIGPMEDVRPYVAKDGLWVSNTTAPDSVRS